MTRIFIRCRNVRIFIHHDVFHFDSSSDFPSVLTTYTLPGRRTKSLIYDFAFENYEFKGTEDAEHGIYGTRRQTPWKTPTKSNH